MDVAYYFDPVDFSVFQNDQHTDWRNSLGALIEKHTQSLTKENFRRLKLVIVGVPFDSKREDPYSSETVDKIREELYQLARFDVKINIADFGNLKPASSTKGCYKAIRDVVDYFNELGIVTLIIGGSQDLSIGVCDAFKSDSFFSYSTIDAFLDIKKTKEPYNSGNYLSRMFISQSHLFQFNLIGYQTHYLTKEEFNKINKGVNTHIRLGNLRDNISVAEPVLRNTDFLSFDINAVKHAEAPGSLKVTPNGLRSEEACQLAKYSGLSNRIKVFGLFDVVPENDRENLTMTLGAQIIWYFIEGFLNRDSISPESNENCIMYKVEVESVDSPVVFYKNTITNQWWVQIEIAGKKNLYIACSEKEYEQAARNEIPELWLNYIQKTDALLK